jgi:hypothetical protein
MRIIFFFWFMFFASSVLAQEIITIQSTITGSQEQPKVISIVPWQKPEDPDYFGQESAALGLMPNVFKTLDRDGFKKELEYISVMKKSAQR